MIEGGPVEEEHRLLAEVDILEELPQDEVEYVDTRCATVRLARCESFSLEEDSRSILLVVKGRVRVHEPSSGDQDLTIAAVEQGTVLTQTGFAPRRSRPLRVEGLERSVLRIMGWEDFEELTCRNPTVGIRMVRLLSERLGACEGRLRDLVRKEVPARLAGLILELSEHQGVVAHDGSRMISRRYTHKQFASMVGSNREALTRALGRLRNAGAVEVRNRRIHITDADTLERLAEAQR